MPSSTQPSSQSSTAKKQQQISSFFGKKPTPISKSNPAPQPSKTTPVYDPGVQPDDEDEGLFFTSDVDDNHDKRITSVTKKRPNQDEVASPNTIIPSRKKPRLSDPSDRSPPQVNHGVSDAHSSNRPLVPVAANSSIKKSKISDRTAKYLFSSSPLQDDENLNDPHLDPDTQKQREQLHQKFVKKLGRPDSIADLRQKSGHLDEADDDEAAAQAEEEEGEAVEPDPKPAKGKKGAAKKSKLTPMEKQVLEIKALHPDTLLIVEVGYKFRFFGEDARTAAKELGIVCIPGKMRYDEHPSEAHIDRFASASIPVHRLHVHTKRLVGAGHKVGVVRQLETAALKAASDNRNAPFTRKLTNLYTKGTYIDDIEGLEGPVAGPSGGAPATGYILCLTETRTKGWGTDEKVNVGILAVQPATGDIVYDDFEDGFMRSEIETRLLHLAPCEFLIVGELSKATEKLVQHLSRSKTNVFGDKIRLERVERPKTMAAQAYSHVSRFYTGKMQATSHEADQQASALLDKILKLTENVTICLSALITHLSDYGLEHVFDLTKYFQSFSARSHMLLNGTTLTSLEIYRNQTDQSEKGSLFWTLDRTQTRFGQRMLRKWVGRPLLDKKKLEERIAAVEELKGGERTIKVDRIKHLLSKTKSDLEKSLIRIYYGKCTRPELLTTLQTLQMIATQFADAEVTGIVSTAFQSPIINDAIAALPTISRDVIGYLDKVNAQAAKEDDKYNFFRDEEETDDIDAHKMGIASVEHDLDTHRAVAAEKVKKKKVEYVTVAGIEYLIEVENTHLKSVPASWVKISGTKKVSRFHTPEVIQLIRQRDQHKEALAAACDTAYSNLLLDISTKYQTFRDCVQALATLDCLLSLATIAEQPGYVKPEYTDEIQIIVEQGRHPMVEQLLLDTYVPNDIDLASDATKALLVTGPNMGGKSSYVRQVALIAIMAQIGSYVPAKSAKLGLFDAVFTRMGAFDNMLAGESTFLVELSETADILKQASPRSLVILDELGRGTSTHDGVAIAQAVLDYVVRELGSLTLFITHYQQLSILANAFESGELQNRHMRFTESGEEVTFLYEIGEGVAHRSYGLNVARLANLPSQVIDVAKVKSQKLEEEVKEKQVGRLSQSLNRMLSSPNSADFDALIEGIELL